MVDSIKGIMILWKRKSKLPNHLGILFPQNGGMWFILLL